MTFAKRHARRRESNYGTDDRDDGSKSDYGDDSK